MVLVEPRALRDLDPDAALVAGSGAVNPGPVWYVRGLDVPYDPLLDPSYGRRDPVVRWAVVEPGTGAVLGRGELPAAEASVRAPGG